MQICRFSDGKIVYIYADSNSFNMVHILLLRGINVSGQKKINMAELRAETEKLGFSSVVTYIQSGNLLLVSRQHSGAEVAGMVGNMIKRVFGFEVSIVPLTLRELKESVENNPFRKTDPAREQNSYFVFLAETPDEKKIAALSKTDFSPEEYFLVDNILYMHSPKGYGKSRLNNNFFESKLKVKATTRNMKTVLRLITLAKELEAAHHSD